MNAHLSRSSSPEVVDLLRGSHHTAVLSIAPGTVESAPITTPLWYSFDPVSFQFTIVTPRMSRKMRHLVAGAPVSLCFVGEIGTGAFVSVRGAVDAVDAISHDDRVTFAVRYRGSEAEHFVTQSTFDDDAMAAVHIAPTRWSARVT
ncbi:MAG: pyridoxamine 5'-phosphate oxidase family protein [Gordonia sp. (in: high G+C Gram-positive bacteria)]